MVIKVKQMNQVGDKVRTMVYLVIPNVLDDPRELVLFVKDSHEFDGDGDAINHNGRLAR